MGLQAECSSTYQGQPQRQHALLRPDSGGLQQGLELKDLLGLAPASTLGLGGFLTLWPVPSFIHPQGVTGGQLAEARVEGYGASSLVFGSWGQKWRAMGPP